MLALLSPFWRQEPFSEPERELLDALFLAHHKSAFRDNPSSVTALNAFSGSGDLAKALAAAILTLGGLHAPLQATQEFLLTDLDKLPFLIEFFIASNHKIPGWGGSFQKDRPDPFWSDVAHLLSTNWPAIASKLDAVTNSLHAKGKPIFPNPSAYTAASSLAISLPPQLAPFLFIAARLSAWSQIAQKLI